MFRRLLQYPRGQDGRVESRDRIELIALTPALAPSEPGHEVVGAAASVDAALALIGDLGTPPDAEGGFVASASDLNRPIGDIGRRSHSNWERHVGRSARRSASSACLSSRPLATERSVTI